MQRSRCLVPFCAFLAAPAVSFAQSPAPATPYVCVAFNTAVLQTAEAQHAFSELQTKFAPRQAHLQQLNAQVEALRKQIDDHAAALSEADKAAKLRTLDTEERQLQRESEDFKGDTDGASQQAFQTVAQKLYAFLQDYAKQHAWMLVIDRGSDAAPVVWYAATQADITADIIKAYDLRNPVAPAASRARPKAALPAAPTPH